MWRMLSPACAIDAFTSSIFFCTFCVSCCPCACKKGNTQDVVALVSPILGTTCHFKAYLQGEHWWVFVAPVVVSQCAMRLTLSGYDLFGHVTTASRSYGWHGWRVHAYVMRCSRESKIGKLAVSLRSIWSIPGRFPGLSGPRLQIDRSERPIFNSREHRMGEPRPAGYHRVRL